MELTLPEGFEGVEMTRLIEGVLPFRSSKYIDNFCNKMYVEGIPTPTALLRVSKDILETKLSTHANFNFMEMADALSLRSAIDPKSTKDAYHKQKGRRQGGTRSPPRGRRGRSRSRRRCPKNGPDNSGGCGGHRNNSRRHRSRKSDKDSWNDKLNKEEKVKPELWAAVAQGDAAKVQELLAQGKDPEEVFEGWSPLMKASEEGNEEVMKMLLEKRVDVDVANRKGRTALSFAAAPSHRDGTPRPTAVAAIRLLLQSGADATKKDKTGATAKDRAEREKRHDAKAVFEEFGV